MDKPVALPPVQYSSAMIATHTPTISQRRSILNELDDCYDTEKACYKQANTDQKIATKLNLPRVWIELIREQFYGVNSGNEATAKVNVVSEEIAKRVKDLANEFYAAMDSFDMKLTKINDDIAALRRDVK